MRKPLFFILNKFPVSQNNFGSLNDQMVEEFSLVVLMVTGHAQHCHFEVTWPATVATIKTIVIACYLPYQMILNQFQSFVMYAAYCGSFQMQFCVSHALSTDLTNFLTPPPPPPPPHTHTHTHTQSNLPIGLSKSGVSLGDRFRLWMKPSSLREGPYPVFRVSLLICFGDWLNLMPICKDRKS